ncbi:MAG TPA: hypothetical protein VMV48_14355 [Gallionellaceae bacterium]|nr:hypothetical protein [Gallionellaceae bacterium]
MRNFIFVLLTAAMALSVNAYGDTPNKAAGDTAVAKSKKCLFPKSRKRAPDWVCSGQADNLAVAAVGSFYKSGAGIEFMQQMAAADARVHLARKLREPVQKKLADSGEAENGNPAERDHALIGKITEEQLQGTRILKSVYGPTGTLYVLVGFDEAGAKKLQESIAADYLKRKR